MVEITTIKTLIKSYFDVVKKNISDTVPKTIITMLINQVKIIFFFIIKFRLKIFLNEN